MQWALAAGSDGAVAQREPHLLVEQLLLQLDVGGSHEGLLALHHHLQDHPIQHRGVVLELQITVKLLQEEVLSDLFVRFIVSRKIYEKLQQQYVWKLVGSHRQ